MADQVLLVYTCIVLLSQHLALSASKSCGSSKCSQDYSPGCPPDISTHLYDNSMSTKLKCNKPIGPAESDSLSVNCYDTCVHNIPESNIPIQTCVDSINVPNVMSVTKDEKSNDVIIEIHPPAVGSDEYQLNKFCRYNIQCPNENYMLHYTVVQVDIEPPIRGQCLDFLRLNFNTTGLNLTSDLCGTLPDKTCQSGDKCGFHDSKLALDFRSNRIYSKGDFKLGIVCSPSSATVKRIVPGSKNRYSVRDQCSPPLSLSARKSTNRPTTAKEFFDKVFPGSFASRSDITVTRGGVVKYRSNMIIVEHKGRILRRFWGIKRLQVHNRIEGYLNFVRNSSPLGRTFPGYGFLRVGRTGIAQYVQTVVHPIYLLTDEEEETVRKLFKEHYNRRKLKNNYYSTSQLNKICSVNRLAERNTASCSRVVRAVANFFLKTDRRKDFCYPTAFKPRFH